MTTSTVFYQGDLRTIAVHNRSGKEITTDAPVDNNGKGEAFSPTDLAATSLAACAITVMGIAAQRDDIRFDDTKIDVTKIMSTDMPRRIVKIVLKFDLHTSRNLSDDEKIKYERIALTCPVSKSLHPDIVQDFSFSWL